MDCPICKGSMWDNRTNKRNPKAPDFKCKNKSCNGVVWENSFKDKNLPEELKAPQTIPNHSGPSLPKAEPKLDIDNQKINAMLLSYSKDIVLALIEKDIIIDDITGKIAEIYQELKKTI